MEGTSRNYAIEPTHFRSEGSLRGQEFLQVTQQVEILVYREVTL